jgi:hypothetical protein
VPNPAKLLFLFLFLFLCPLRLDGANSLFAEQAAIEVELAGPIHHLIKNKETREERPFVLRVDDRELDVHVRVRGNSRVRICKFPPLRLRFPDEQSMSSVFDGQNKLKLVTHCLNSASGDQYVLEEYIAYRIFGLISDVGYRVRLLHIRYTDSDGLLDEDTPERYGFVIEPRDQLAERVSGIPLNLDGVLLSQVNRHQAALVYVFQYLIGNTDWSFVVADNDDECCHNGDLLEIDKDIYYLPYDFDLAGIVNTRYAKPDPSLKIRNVRTRRYRGFCTETDILRAAIRHVQSLREDIFSIVGQTPGLTGRDKEKLVEYLEEYFKEAENEGKLLKLFEKRCID